MSQTLLGLSQLYAVSERLWQQTFLSSTYFRCFQTPSSGLRIRSVARKLLQLKPTLRRPAGQKIFDRPSAMYRRAVPYYSGIHKY